MWHQLGILVTDDELHEQVGHLEDECGVYVDIEVVPFRLRLDKVESWYSPDDEVIVVQMESGAEHELTGNVKEFQSKLNEVRRWLLRT